MHFLCFAEDAFRFTRYGASDDGICATQFKPHILVLELHVTVEQTDITDSNTPSKSLDSALDLQQWVPPIGNLGNSSRTLSLSPQRYVCIPIFDFLYKPSFPARTDNRLQPFLAYYLARQILTRLDPDAGAKAEAQQKALAATNRLHSIFSREDRDEDGFREDDDGDEPPAYDERPNKEELTLNAYEQTIAMEVVSPGEIPVTFNDIGGLDDIIEELRESVIYPLTLPHLYTGHSSLLTAPSGVLLYGPPGCGKTMLAKALARESGACFINLHISTLTEKWYGDSNKLVAAVFSLARKLQPSIVFIDEIDAVLGQRRSGEHEASGMVKAEFMTHWDGLSSSTTQSGSQRICILGCHQSHPGHRRSYLAASAQEVPSLTPKRQPTATDLRPHAQRHEG